MKNIKEIYLFPLICLLTLLWSCVTEDMLDRDSDNALTEYGEVTLSKLFLDIAPISVAVESRAASDYDDFNVEIRKSNGKDIVYGPVSYGDITKLSSIPLPVGSYMVYATGGSKTAVGFDSPAYEGKSGVFYISNNKLTVVDTVGCEITNVAVSIKIDSELEEMIDDMSKTHVTVYNNVDYPLIYGREHFRTSSNPIGKTGFFEERSGSMIAIFVSVIGGNEVELRQNLPALTKGQHRLITYSVKSSGEGPSSGPGSGTGSFNIVSDIVDQDMGKIYADDPKDKEAGEGGDVDIVRPGDDDPTVDRDEPSEPENPNDPGKDESVNTIELKYSKDIDPSKENSVFEDGDYTVTISSENIIEKLMITISSTDNNFEDIITEVGLDEFDLLHPTSSQEELFETLEFPCGEAIQGKTKIDVALSALIPMLGGFPGFHTFNLEVTDAKSFSKSVSIKFRVIKNEN